MSIYFSGNSSLFGYAILSTKVHQVLCRLEKGVDIGEKGYDILKGAKSIITDIVRGSILIDNKQSKNGVSPSQKGLFAYRHALSAIDELQLAVNDTDITDLFLKYRDHLSTLSKKCALKGDELSQLKIFFNTLSDMFNRDLMVNAYKKPKKAARQFRTNTPFRV